MRLASLNFLFLTFCTFISSTLYAQYTYTYFTAGTDLCSHDGWKLVWHDEFNGTGHDYNWNDNDGYYNDNEHCVYKTDNVIQSNGTLKLITKLETSVSSDGHTEPYSGGEVTSGLFCEGRFEARIRFGRQLNSWGAFWLYNGETPPHGSEIDIAEITCPLCGDMTYSLHSYTSSGSSYGNEEGTDYKTHDYWTKWHIYTCDWEDNTVTIYIDGVQVKKWYKYGYAYPLGVAPLGSCTIPSTGYWAIWPSFPQYTPHIASPPVWPKSDPNQLVIMLTNKKLTGGSFPGDTLEVDYVRYYQRDAQCNASNNAYTISGDSHFCAPPNSNHTYTVTPSSVATPLTWLATSGMSFVSQTGNQATYNATTPGSFSNDQLVAIDANGCLATQPYYVAVSSTPSISTVSAQCSHSTEYDSFNPAIHWTYINWVLTPQPEEPGVHYYWLYSFGGYYYHPTTTGPLILSGMIMPYITWIVIAYNDCGATINFGSKHCSSSPPWWLGRTANNGDNNDLSGQHTYHFNDSTDAMQWALEKLNGKKIIDVQGDSLVLTAKDADSLYSMPAGHTVLYPNPAQNQISILFDPAFYNNQIIIQINDVYGRTIDNKVINNISDAPINMDIATYKPGVYFMNIKNGSGQSEIQKFIKR